jgi:protein-S-isoprenylcysteine O-methyltransferase Ste14
MKDLPGILLVATVWAYWFGVGIMIARTHRDTKRLAGLVPELRVEKYLWLLWVPLVVAWIIVPYLALTRAGGPWAVPGFARHDAGYAVLRWLGAFGALASLLLTSLCWARMGRHWRMDVGRQKGELITNGPFRYLRHPIYALLRLLMVCSIAIAPTWPMLGLAVVLFALTEVKARYEERHLSVLHGATYRDYLAHTGRFLPLRAASKRRSRPVLERSAPGGES